MPRLRLALAQVDPTVGDLAHNTAIVRDWCGKAAEAGADLVVFPEMVITGYPVEDLVFRESFVAASQAAVAQLARDLAEDGLGDVPVIVGYLDADGPARAGTAARQRGGPRNAAAVLRDGQIAARYFKHHLPNYGVFDEDRYFVPGNALTIVRIAGVDVALTICEDLWQAGGPFTVAGQAGVGLVLSLNGSPYEAGKADTRRALVAGRSAEAGAPVAYVNLVGGQDELVFDGDSMIVLPDGTLLARAPRFVENLMVVDLDLPAATIDPGGTAPAAAQAGAGGMVVERHALADRTTAPDLARRVAAPAPLIAPPSDGEAEVWKALVLGLGDYARKNGFRSVVLGLSGGIDSALVAAIACDAVGERNVVGVSMPSEYSSDHSRDDAAELAKRTGLDYRIIPVQPMVDSFLTNVSRAGTALTGLAVENLQARVRGVTLMALSNQEGHLVLTTGNKSELAVGYSTLYGDSVGGFNPIKDVPKTLVWQLARWRNAEAERHGDLAPIPESSITKPPSAELRPGQLDTDSLPDYEVLDELLGGYVDGDLGRDGLVALGYDPALVDRVLRLVDLAEYKRRQSAPGTKISMKSFGRDRRLPVTNRFRERRG
jgi:NAD+ synthase (glutamine-hydrolysing)